MATLFNLKPFRFNLTDLNFMLDQIKFQPLFDAAGNAIIAWDGTTAIYTANQTLIMDPTANGTHVVTATEATANTVAYGTSYDSITASQGLRDVTGLNNNLLLVNHLWGSVDQPFMRFVPANFTGYVQPVAANPDAFYGAKTFASSTLGTANYAAIDLTTHLPVAINDYTPRMISRTITTGGATPLQDANHQVVHWHAGQYETDLTYRHLFDAMRLDQTRISVAAAAAWTAWDNAIAGKAAALTAQATAVSAVAAAIATEATDLGLLRSANELATAKLALEQGAIAAQLTAQTDYATAYAAVVFPALALETAALAARDALDPTTAEWAALNTDYLQAVEVRTTAQASVQPLLDFRDAAILTASTAHQASVDAQAAQVTAQSVYDQAVIDHANADAVLVGAVTSLTTATTVASTAHNAATAVIGLIEGAAVVADLGILAGGQHDPQDPTNGEVFFGSVNPGVAPGNSFLAYFGQFFDHGLDFIDKGGAKITIPLAIDDPLYRAPNTNFAGDPGNTKITVTRAIVVHDANGQPILDANGDPQYVNHSSPYIDQSQTYGSREQMTLLLREWVSTDGANYHAGSNLLDGHTSHAWKNAFGETVTSTLPTLNELRAHLLATGREPLTWEDVLNLRTRSADGKTIIGDNAATTGVDEGQTGQALLLDMNPHFDAAHFSAATKRALDTIGIHADANGNYALGGPPGSVTLGTVIDFRTFTGKPGFEALANDILLDSVGDHYIAGDGRVNENVGLTTIHHIFHEEHNFQVRNIQDAILAQDARAVTLGDASHSIAHDWQVATNYMDANGNYRMGSPTGAISWDVDRIFNAAKLTVEMEYQHAAVDQYARTITPDLPEFVGYNSGENATVSLEYAQSAFRFGHSTMRETIDIMDPTGSITGKVMSVALEQAFLNPALYAQKGAAAIAMGMTHQQMNEIDELITPALNQGLLGQPLDLAAINIARGRDIGIPTLNEFRAAVGLTKYVSWADFGAHMVHPESLVNFIAAYSFDGDVAKAQAIVGLENGTIAEETAAAMGYTLTRAIGFLNGDPTVAGSDGFNHIDTWLGGLAEAHVMGGLLGETFNLVFLNQINRLMDGDRFYYLYRLNNLNMGDEIANAQLKDIIERNTGLEHLNGSAFAYADQYIDLSAKVDSVRNADTGNFKVDHKYGQILEDRATAQLPGIGVYSIGGTGTASNGGVVTVGGVQYIRDIRAVGANGNLNVNGTNLDGAPDTGANSNEVLIGTDKNDLLYMGGGDDTAYGEGGNDIIYGDAGIDRLYGGAGNDEIHGGDSGDLIDGGAGDDKLYGDSSGSAAAGVDQIIGGDGNDIIYGGVGIDKLSGGAGDDVIFGGGDTDPFTHGGDGNDYIDGQSDGDILWGDGGDDLLVGGNNQDIVAGGDGDDILRPGNPSSAAGGGPDEVLGGDGKSDAGNDGKGVGFDLIDFSDYVASIAGGINADFSTQTNPAVAINLNTPFPAWIGIEGLIGSRNNDTVVADANNNWLFGGSGNDTLTGGGGNDIIIGDGIRLDSLIGTYSGGYTHEFDTATHRALGFIGTNGLLDAVGMGNQKHFTEMLKSGMFKDLELGGSAIKALQVDGVNVADTRVGDGGTAGTDTVVFSGNRADYTVEKITFTTANQGFITAYKITDSVTGRDGTDIVAGVEWFKFTDGALDEANLFNRPPVIDSNGGLASAAITFAENGLAPVTTVHATDPDTGAILSYSISGGADAAKFAINDATGVLSFLTSPNFEAPTDADMNNVYDVIIKVSDQLGASDTQTLAVTVGNVDEAPTGSLNVTDYQPRGNIRDASATLTATNTLGADPDSPAASVSVQWQRAVINPADGTITSWTNVGSPNSLVLSNASNGTYRIVETYTDAFGAKTIASTETVVVGSTAGQTFNGTVGNTIMLGLGGNDTLNWSTGTDILDGGSGTDTASFATTTQGVTVNLAAAATVPGLNPAQVAGTATGSELDGLGVAVAFTDYLISIENVIGGSGNDVLTGDGTVNVLTGGGGNDTLDGGLGADTLVGGAGDDTYVLNDADTVTEGSNAGTDTVLSSLTSYTLAANVENLTLTGNGNINGTGNGLANLILGNSGNNVIDGRAGADRMVGGAGNDTYIVDNVGDIVTELASEGADLVQSSVTYALSANVESLTLTGNGNINGTGNGLDNVITGNAESNRLDGGQGADTLIGGAGNDTYIVDNIGDIITEALAAGNDTIQSAVSFTTSLNVENLTLTGTAAINATGNTLANTLTGNSADNILDGGIGADTMIGGAGNDTYFVDMATDIVRELVGQGTDLVQSSVDYTLTTNVENLTLTGTAITGTGNTLDNIITGNVGNNVLSAGGGNDRLTGGVGDDMLTGGTGADTFVFATGFGKDIIVDFRAGAGVVDVLELSLGTAFDTLAEVVAAAAQVGNNTVITFDANTSITLQGVQKTAFVADDFHFA
jgi:Ca2+-binding RTX toxin-like protein